MKDKLTLLNEQEVLGKHFAMYGTPEEPLFLAKDVAEWIEHKDVSTMMRNIDETEKLTQTMFVSGQNREVWLLTEDGLYEVLMQSRKPIAKAFKKEIKEILKSIRKHGAYMTPETLDRMISSPEFGIRLLTALKDEQEKRKELEQENAAQRQRIGEMRPKEIFADAVSVSDDSILMVYRVLEEEKVIMIVSMWTHYEI